MKIKFWTKKEEVVVVPPTKMEQFQAFAKEAAPSAAGTAAALIGVAGIKAIARGLVNWYEKPVALQVPAAPVQPTPAPVVDPAQQPQPAVNTLQGQPVTP